MKCLFLLKHDTNVSLFLLKHEKFSSVNVTALLSSQHIDPNEAFARLLRLCFNAPNAPVALIRQTQRKKFA